MLDRKFIIQNPDAVSENCRRRGVTCDIEKLVSLERQRIESLQLAEEACPNDGTPEELDDEEDLRESDGRQQTPARAAHRGWVRRA